MSDTNLKIDIRTFSKSELQTYFKSKNHPSYRADQVYQWLWNKGVSSFEEMTNLSLELRAFLQTHFEIRNVTNLHAQKSDDGTLKNAVKLHDELVVESVLIPTEKRTTACVSSQVGCSLDCKFCATAQLERMRNLNADEIFDQVKLIDRQSRTIYNRPLSNIVFMGMGEPLMNYNNVLKAIEIITSKEGLHKYPKRITLSTSGIPKLIKKLADDNAKINLALSLHSARQEVREQIMPFAKKFPIEDLIDALQYWYSQTKSRVTLEYLVWKGVNDTQADIKALLNFCKKTVCKVNIIEYNSIDDDKFQQADNATIEAYVRALEAQKVTVTVRRSRGKDIDAACGQLANKSVNL